MGDPYKESIMKTPSEETERTESTETKTTHHSKGAEPAIFPSDKELAAHGFFQRGGNWGVGMIQDFRNIRLAPAGDKSYHFFAGSAKAVFYITAAEGAYSIGKWCLAKLAARKAAAKLASRLTGLEVGDSAEVSMTATAASYCDRGWIQKFRSSL